MEVADGRLYPWEKKTWYPLYRKLGGHRGWSGQVRKISLSPGFETQTVQLVASRYIDYGIPAAIEWVIEETRTVTIFFFSESLESQRSPRSLSVILDDDNNNNNNNNNNKMHGNV
jgi:hypothetical protein